MRCFLVACLVLALPVFAVAELDTLKAGIGEPFAGFYLGNGIDSARVAIRLPADLEGKMIYSIRTLLRPPVEGAVDPGVWAQHAKFTWGLSYGSGQQPLEATGDLAVLPLNSNPDLSLGGWSQTAVEWPILLGYQYWLVGYWHKSAPFIRLTQNQPDPVCDIAIGYRQSGVEYWQEWYGSGLVLEIAFGEPGLGVPSGILDLGENSAQGANRIEYASISGGSLTIAIDRSTLSFLPYTLEVVNVLGQSVVSTTGFVDAAEMRIPWSANRPSGVYFCRVRLGDGSAQTIPVVNLK